ncbi:sulfatase-like hydrolase/transferase, partial [bacterium]|nr:sulfatase-like hydrolase/transferase [bacterium]
MHAPTRRTFLGTAAATATALTSFAHAHDGDEMPTRPNILFLYPDQHRYDWLGDGSPVPVRTPHLDALARLGVRFTQALTPSPLCAPARACLAAGKEYDRCRVPTNGTDFPLDQTTVYALLRESGYHVIGCGKFDLHKASPTWGIDGTKHLAEWGFSDGVDNAGKWDAIHSGRQSPRDPYMHYLEQRGLREAHVADFAKRRGSKAAVHATPLPDDAYCDNWIGDNGIQLLRRAPMGRPWFLQVNFTGPHDPWDITQAMSKLYDGVRFPPPNRGARLTPQQHNAVRQNYSAMVGNIDRWLGRFVTELRNNGELDNTLIVFSSDHGEMLGDHGRWGKCMPHQPSVGVPLVVAGPGVRKGHVCHEPTTTLDLTATFLQAAGLEVPKDMDSRSLLPLLRDDTDKHRDHVLSGLQGWRLVFDGRHKLIRGSRLGKLK